MFMLDNKHLGFDELETATGKSKIEIIKTWNFLTDYDWKGVYCK